MKIQPEVIAALHASAEAHWTAIHTYTAQAAHLKRAGYRKLAEALDDDVEEEQRHLRKLAKRLELGGQSLKASGGEGDWERGDYGSILECNLALERAAADIERAGVKTAREAMDEGSADVFEHNLRGTEDGIEELEAQQQQIRDIGLDNFLADKL